MSEPRMRARPKGAQFSPIELEAMLTAYGDDWKPLSETIRILDEITTDFIIETAHLAAVAPMLAHRSKIKVDDFKFALRKDPKKLGRVTELLNMERDLKRKRKYFDDSEGLQPGPGRGKGRRKDGVSGGEGLVEEQGSEKKKKKIGRRKKKKVEDEEQLGASGSDGE